MLQPAPILQEAFVDPPWAWANGAKLPGVGPVAPDDWLRLDDAYAAQMALRDGLVRERRSLVHAQLPEAEQATHETLGLALRVLKKKESYQLSTEQIVRPDGATVPIDWDTPLITLGRLVQEDICILLKRDGMHVLVAAILCFPASWTLAEKIGKPMAAIHAPVPEYDPQMGRRVDRMFTALRPGQTIRRGNCLAYDDFALFQPRREADRYAPPGPKARYIRTKRQCLLKLPDTEALVFSIHTCVRERAALNAADAAAVAAHLDRIAAP